MELLTVCMFPFWFMVHEMEEIICTGRWFERNEAKLRQRFPRMTGSIIRMGRLSVPAFAVAVAEELVIVGAVTYTAVAWEYYFIWVALLGAYTLNLLMHIGQCAVWGGYVPGVITSVLCLPYCLYALNAANAVFTLPQIALCTAGGAVIAAANLRLAHRLAYAVNRSITGNA